MFNEGSIPAIIKIDGNKVGSSVAIQSFGNIPQKFRPENPLQADMVKETDWERAKTEITLISILTLVLLPFGK
jgi:hypothetical protein